MISYQGEYHALADKLCEYVVKLLDQVRGNDELDVILNEKRGFMVYGDSPDRLARLHLAVKYNQKRVSGFDLFNELCLNVLITTIAPNVTKYYS